MSSSRLTDGFREIIELPWSELVAMEESLDATNFDSVITGIARAAQKSNLRAIQTALDRLDGKIATEIEMEYPKFYTLYPNATKRADDPSIIELTELTEVKPLDTGVDTRILGAPADLDELEAANEEMPTGSLRAVLERMLDSPKQSVVDILAASKAIDQGVFELGNPRVKNVIVAGLMKLVHEGRISAVFEVFDQIDGKVAEKIKALGNDVYVKRFDLIAPAGAEKNENGIYQVVSEQMTNTWQIRLEASARGKR